MKLEIIDTKKATSDSITFRFRKTGELQNYRAGQHGIFRFRINGQSVTRTYSFHSSPHADDHLAITVKAVEKGIVSQYVMSSPIDELALEAVSGDFVIEPSFERKRHVVCFAGGSGITPIMSMIRSLLHKEPGSSVSLVYSNSFVSNIIFRNELTNLEAQFKDRFKIYHVITKDSNIPAGFPLFYRGRLSKLIVKKLVMGMLSEKQLCTEFYLCGPFEFMNVVDEAIRGINVDRLRIFKEHFYIPDRKGAELEVLNFPPREVILQLKSEDRLLIVDGGQSILEAALQNGIALQHSCKQGQCGVCRAFILGGEVRLRKNSILTDDEIKVGQSLLCQAYPASDNVVVRPIKEQDT